MEIWIKDLAARSDYCDDIRWTQSYNGDVDLGGGRHSVLANGLCAAFSGVIIAISIIIIIRAWVFMFQILSWEHDTVEATDRSLRILCLHFGTLLGCPRVVSRSECTYLAFTFRGSDWFSSVRIAKIKYDNRKHGYLFSGYDFMPVSAGMHKRNTDLDNTSMSPTAKLSKFESWLCGFSFSTYKMVIKCYLIEFLWWLSELIFVKWLEPWLAYIPKY